MRIDIRDARIAGERTEAAAVGDVAGDGPTGALIAFEDGWTIAAKQVVRERDVLGQQRAATATQSVVKSHGRAADVDNCVVRDDGVFDLEVLIESRIRHTGRNRNRATRSIIDVRDVVVDDRLPLADHANRAGIVGVFAEEEITFDPVVIAVAQRERGGHVTKRVVAKSIAAGFVGDRFDFAVGVLEDIVLDRREGIALRVVARADANGFKAIRVGRIDRNRTAGKVVRIDFVVVRTVIGRQTTTVTPECV